MANESQDLGEIVEDADIISIKRPSNPFKQLVAGVSDVGTALPAIGGLIGGAWEATGRSMDQMYDPSGAQQKDWLQNFTDSIAQGTDADLLESSRSGRDWVNEQLGIQDPVSTEDQAARILGGAILPVPGAAIASKAGKIATYLTPVIGTGAKFGRRAGVQTGIFGGVDQGVKSLTGEPLIFSDRALSGDTTLEKIAQGKDGVISGREGQDELKGGAGDDELQVEYITDDQIVSGTPEYITDDQIVPPTEEGIDPQLVAAQKAAEEDDDDSNLGFISAVAATVGAMYLAKKGKLKVITDNLPTKTAKQIDDDVSKDKGILTDSFKNKLGGKVFDSKQLLREDITKRNIEAGMSPEEAAAKAAEQVGTGLQDVYGSVVDFIKNGILPQSGVKIKSIKKIKQDFDALTPDEQKVFTEGIASFSENVIRNRATAADFVTKAKETGHTSEALTRVQNALDAPEESAKLLDELFEDEAVLAAMKSVRGTDKRITPGLFVEDAKGVKKFVEDPDIKKNIQALRESPRLLQMHKDLAKQNEVILDESVRLGVMNEDVAKSWKSKFTTQDGIMYIPGKELRDKTTFFKRLARQFGAHSTTGKRFEDVANWEARSLETGGGLSVKQVDPFEATGDYVYQVMKHVNLSQKQWSVASKIAGISDELDANGNAVRPAGIDIAKANDIDAVRYVGKGIWKNPDEAAGSYELQPGIGASDDVVKNQLSLDRNVAAPRVLRDMEDVIWVQKNGDYHGFLVKNKHMKSALEFDAALTGRWINGLRMTKNIYTGGTTGKYSLFAPISFGYNQTMGSLNAALKAEGGLLKAGAEGLKVFRDGFVGAWEIVAVKTAEDVSSILTRQLGRQDIGQGHREWATRVNKAAQKRIKRSLLSPIERETGKTASSLGAHDYADNLTDIMQEAIPHIRNTYTGNALPQFWRIWQHLNTAMQEGTAVGITMRKMAGDVNPSAIKKGRAYADDLVGDVRLTGASDTAKAINAAVPYSGAMLQAFSTFGRAVNKAGWAKTSALLVTGIGMPTALEVTYNNSLDEIDENGNPITFADADGREWTYSEYYWKGFTADQRNNNGIVMIPGKPPWEAFLAPIVPEVSFMRGLVIDGMESVFGLSGKRLDQGNHFKAGLVRLFDVPLPPVISAGMSSLGVDVKAGLIPDEDGFTLAKAVPFGQGQRVAPNQGDNKYIGEEVDRKVAAVLQDVFGAAGSAGVAVYESFSPSTKAYREKMTFGERASYVLDTVGAQAKGQARYIQPLFGKSLRYNPNNDQALEVLRKKDSLSELRKNISGLLTEEKGTATALGAGDTTLPGATQEVPQDPITRILSVNSEKILSEIAPLDRAITDLRKKVASLGTSSYNPITNTPTSVAERNDLMDAFNMQISKLKSHQLQILKAREKEMGDFITKKFGRDGSSFSFENYEDIIRGR